jgi:cell wall-associated NlpC family hydrolase
MNKELASLDQAYDAERQTTTQAARVVRAQAAVVARTNKAVAGQRNQVVQIAITYYEDQGQTSPAAMLTSSHALAALRQSSVLQELSQNDATVIRTYEADVARLTALRATQARYEAATEALHRAVKTRKHQLAALSKREDALLRQLAPAQTAGLGPGGVSTPGSYTGPTSTQAEKAVSFVYAQLGCPYVWGGTGPCSAGYDCSGLVQAAWAYAGVAIPRTSEEQLAGLPTVPVADIQPGDLIIMLNGDHVGMYVGGGYLIDAPHTGAVVERVPYTGWYTANTTAIVRP